MNLLYYTKKKEKTFQNIGKFELRMSKDGGLRFKKKVAGYWDRWENIKRETDS